MVQRENEKIRSAMINLEKKFNVGITLETNRREFDAFLETYHPYIHSFYFSLPTSYLYHTRTKIAAEFLLPGKKRLFWYMLERAAEYGIELELLFNTLRLDDALVEDAARTLDAHGIRVDSVCFLRPYYDAVVKCFPDKKLIWSFNNGFRSRDELSAVLDEHRGDAVVLGSLFIRNNALFEQLGQRGCPAYLLLNNACSFNCDTCNNTQSVCQSAFEENLKKHSVEYLYALQSIFPFELHDGIIDVTRVQCLKLSNRSSSLSFTADALDSYLNNEVEKYVRADKNNYAIWGRAGYFWKHYGRMDLDAILRIKEELLLGGRSPS